MNKRKAYCLYNFSYFHTLLYENGVILIIINFLYLRYYIIINIYYYKLLRFYKLYLRYIYDSILIKIDRDTINFIFQRSFYY